MQLRPHSHCRKRCVEPLQLLQDVNLRCQCFQACGLQQLYALVVVIEAQHLQSRLKAKSLRPRGSSCPAEATPTTATNTNTTCPTETTTWPTKTAATALQLRGSNFDLLPQSLRADALGVTRGRHRERFQSRLHDSELTLWTFVR